MKKTYDLKIIKKEILNDEIFKIVLEMPEDMPEILPGQFFGLSVSDNGYPLLRRPISVSKVEDNSFELTIKVLGEGTLLLLKKEVNETINVLGPVGNGFFLDDMSENSIIVGGGIGVSPIKELARVMKETLKKDIPVLLGFRDRPFDMDDFNEVSSDIEIATESGVVGVKGYVTTLLEERLKSNKPEVVYVCGPHMMLKAVKELCERYDVPTQLLMEERMACGIGACLVCTCAIKDGHEITNKRVCKDGPVFYGSEVVFDV
ncbi:MAG: dihydroorotate dehydrogenase electron transfer subunit [Clostridiales bacterium]|nr:dihydroorotate dehydrogenase electron transfer subunit [Clostridiales bacterium]